MGDHAIGTLVGRAGRDHDHFLLGLGQAALAQHHRIVIGEKRSELVRPARQDQEHVRDEAGLGAHCLDPLPEIDRQGLEGGDVEAADRRFGHPARARPTWRANQRE
jgi:hypothetical protein